MGEDLSDFPMPSQKGRVGLSRGWLIAHTIAWGAFLLTLAFVPARLDNLFRDFGVDLPAATVLVLKVSHLGPAPFLLFLALLLGSERFLIDARSSRWEIRELRAWAVLMLAVPIVLFAAVVVSLAYPLLRLYGSLSR